MDSLDLIQTFREVARRGSFSAAARALDMSPANVSKYVAQLEARFGVRLFQRTTRKVSLTDAGHLLFERSGALLELIELTEGELHDRATRPSGRLSLTAPHGLMQSELPALLGRFMQQHPAVSVHLHVTNRVVNMVDEGVDLALRIGPIPDDNLIVRRLLRLEYVAAAAPAYWRQHGRPQHPRDLLEHQQLAYALPGESPRWHFHVDGKSFDISPQPVFTATDPAPLPVLAAQGLGVIWTARLAIMPQLDSGELEAVLGDYSAQDVWLFAAYTQRRHNSAALRALLDHLDESLRTQVESPLAPAKPAAGVAAAAKRGMTRRPVQTG